MENETILASLDSRLGGTDIGFGIDTKDPVYETSETDKITSAPTIAYPALRKVRVIIGKLGPTIRLSAIDLNLIADGQNFFDAWANLCALIKNREDRQYLRFDVGPLRREEIDRALDAPEDEDWSGLLIDAEN